MTLQGRIHGYDLYTVSAWIHQVHAANGSVGIIISKEASTSLINKKRVTNRIMTDNPVFITIVTYAPCEFGDEIVNNIFYEQLRTTIGKVTSHNFLIIFSDTTARMGPEDVKYTYNISTKIM